MSIISGFFDAKAAGDSWDRLYTSSNFCDYLGDIICDGVITDNGLNGDDLLVTYAGAKHVTVLPGKCWINGHYMRLEDTLYFDLDTVTEISGSCYVVICAYCDESDDVRECGITAVSYSGDLPDDADEFAETLKAEKDTDTIHYVPLAVFYTDDYSSTGITADSYKDMRYYCRCILGHCKATEVLEAAREELSDYIDDKFSEQTVTAAWYDENGATYNGALSSVVIGSSSNSSTGIYSIAGGYSTEASGQYAVSSGLNTISDGYCQFTIGCFNVASGEFSNTKINAFVIGDGTISARHNLLTVSWDGKININSDDASAGFYLNGEQVIGTTGGAAWYDTTSDGAYGTGVIIGSSTNKATGHCSSADGYNTTASGVSAHSEGNGSVASGDHAHAEGDTTTASGMYAHAEGHDTTAEKSCAHAEGDGSTASGKDSHAEGYNTEASNSCAHAEGSSTHATGGYSHAEGINTYANGNFSHAQGDSTIADGKYQTVMGCCNVEDTEEKSALIIGDGNGEDDRHNLFTVNWDGTVTINDVDLDLTQIAAWYDTASEDASGTGVIVGNKSNSAPGRNSLASGNGNTADGIGAVSIGHSNTSSGQYSAAFGSSNFTDGASSAVFGSGNSVSGGEALAWGIDNTVDGTAATACGTNNSVTGTYSFVGGEYNNVEGQDTLVFGAHLEVIADHQFTLGQYNESVQNCHVVIGDGTADTARHNLLTVTKDGKVNLYSDEEDAGFYLNGEKISGGGDTPAFTAITADEVKEMF